MNIYYETVSGEIKKKHIIKMIKKNVMVQLSTYIVMMVSGP